MTVVNEEWYERFSKYWKEKEGIWTYEIGDKLIQETSLNNFRKIGVLNRTDREVINGWWVQLGAYVRERPDYSVYACSHMRRANIGRLAWNGQIMSVAEEFVAKQRDEVVFTCTHPVKSRLDCHRAEIAAAFFVMFGGLSNPRLDEVISLLEQVNEPSFWWTIPRSQSDLPDVLSVDLMIEKDVGVYWAMKEYTDVADKYAVLVRNNKDGGYELIGNKELLDDIFYFAAVGQLHRSRRQWWRYSGTWQKVLGWE